ncbi:hypothetical protein KP509_17G075000 [Ceratopteris richardii]|uniref:DNA ligase n=1 Tax=Ceratopteris richardii TaxID=49495 RepID=A0A8T2SYZ0_CERRI|nr:hypothetical protein KP509_17G075000 [Ceratopteris richardii]
MIEEELKQASGRSSINSSALFEAALRKISAAQSHLVGGDDEPSETEAQGLVTPSYVGRSIQIFEVEYRDQTSLGSISAETKCSERPSVSSQRAFSKISEVESSISTSSCMQNISFPSSIPYHKRIPGTSFIVDGFPHAGPWSRCYFLSHFHSDHYTGLTSSWNKGIIFCSRVTARLVVKFIKVSEHFVYDLDMGELVEIDNCLLTLVDANHCPGAVQFLFQVPTEKDRTFLRYLHTGDMRYSPAMKSESSLCDFIGANAVFLDTTYCNPKYVFPTQDESIGYIAETIFALRKEGNEDFKDLSNLYNAAEELDEMLMQGENVPDLRLSNTDVQATGLIEGTSFPIKGGSVPEDLEMNDQRLTTVTQLEGKQNGRTLFLISTYAIGKEKILLAVAKRCNCLIYVNERKLSMLKCLDLKDLSAFTTEPSATNVHVVSWNFLGETWPFFRPNFRKMEELLRRSGFERIVGFVPTGWTYEIKKTTFSVRRKGPLEIHLVPYSEHSNYDELREYIAFLRPHEIIPTVGLEGGDMDGKAVATIREHFRNLVDETASKRQFLKGFRRKRVSQNTIQEPMPNTTGTMQDILKSKVVSDDDEGISIVPEDLQEVFSAIDRKDMKEFPKSVFVRKAKKAKLVVGRCDKLEGSSSIVSDGEKGSAELETLPTVSHISSEINQGLHDYTQGFNFSKEKKEQLKAVLPRYINEMEVNDLLVKANGDLNLAAVLYFESSQNAHHQQAISENSVQALYRETDAALPSMVCALAGAQVWISESETALMSGTMNKKKYRSGASPAVKRSRGSQASILTFFKKSNSEIDSENSNLYAKEARQEDTEKIQDANASLHQLVSVLGGAVSLDEAQTLLKQSQGDMGTALELHNARSHMSPLARNLQNECSERFFVTGTRNCSLPATTELNLSADQEHKRKEKFGYQGMVTLSESRDDFIAMPIYEYKPIEFACWQSGEPAPYMHLARTFELVEQERGRLKTSDMLCNMFRSLLALSPDAVLPAIYLSTNQIAPDYENVDLNVGGSTVAAAISEATGTPKSKIKDMYNNMGDLGDVAQACRKTQSLLVAPHILSIQQVFSTLLQISKESGTGSGLRKKNLILSLLRASRVKEMKYIVRTLVRNMRIGANMRSVLPALAQAIVLHTCESKNEQLKDELQKVSSEIMEAYNYMPNLNILVPALLQDGIRTVLTNVTVSPGIPVKPMLAKIASGIMEVFKRFQGKPFAVEYKYDGQRAQVHLIRDGTIKIFSRNCEDLTLRFPDVFDIVHAAVTDGVQDLIFDAEIVAVDRGNNNKLLAFQHLSTRERGRGGAAVNLENIKVEVCLFVFDLMYANGKPYVKLPLRERNKRMEECFRIPKAGYFEFANRIMVLLLQIEGQEADIENSLSVMQVEKFLEEAFSSSCEGIMVKALDEDSVYAPSKRSDSWLKVKRDYVEGLHDTLDLVPIGAWHGNGRKAGWFSPFLMACYDGDREEYQSVCRVMSGFTDAFYKEMKAFYIGEHVLPRKPSYYVTLEEPDVWFTPKRVWEIRGADLTVSPVHQAAAGLVHHSRGISLRFPRFIKERSDKNVEDTTTPLEIAELFQKQSRKLEMPADGGHGRDKEEHN